MMDELQHKAEVLDEVLRSMERVAVAFSGGVDSSLLLAESVRVLGAEAVVALTADSPLLARSEYAAARSLAKSLGVEHVILAFDELEVPEIRGNGPRRCYYCKKARFEALLRWIETSRPGAVLVHGENQDDLRDYRPGSQAAHELGVRAPLVEADMTKGDIRRLSQQRGLPTWDTPAAACLATRFPTGTALTRDGLARVEAAEQALVKVLGPANMRVRDHYPVARIEIDESIMGGLLDAGVREQVGRALRDIGYRYVTLDLQGYRMGSMNEQA